MTDKAPPASDHPYHCATHGWWSAIKESGCPACVRESRSRIRSLESELATAQQETREMTQAAQAEAVMADQERKLRAAAEQEVQRLREELEAQRARAEAGMDNMRGFLGKCHEARIAAEARLAATPGTAQQGFGNGAAGNYVGPAEGSGAAGFAKVGAKLLAALRNEGTEG